MAVNAEGDQFGRRDRIGYRDPNVPYEAFPRVRLVLRQRKPRQGKTRINASPKRKIGSPERPIDTKPP